MKLNKKCDCCGVLFEYSPSRRPNARFCSRNCLSKLTKFEQDQKRRVDWSNETPQQYIDAMKIKFEKFVLKKDGCWDWNGSKHKQGYGVMLHRGKLLKSHRVSFMIYNGHIPNGSFVLHTCDNTSCSNPKHLFLGSQIDNMRDMVIKDRNISHGKNQFNSKKLTIEDISKIKDLFMNNKSCAEISRLLSINRKTVYKAKNGLINERSYIKVGKLNKDIVSDIKKLLKIGVVGKKIAKDFGISYTTLQSIKTGKTWKDIE